MLFHPADHTDVCDPARTSTAEGHADRRPAWITNNGRPELLLE
jgi:hypothetical protein